MSASDNLIGHGACPVCGNKKARFTVSKKSLACMTCNACNIQIFARSDSSDEKLRGFIAEAAAQQVDPEQQPAPASTPAPATPQPTTKPGPGWGILGAFHA